MDKQIGYAGSFDGMITEYKGNNPIYMSAEQKAEAKKYQDIFFSAVLTWKTANADKLLTFQGYPENLIEQTILTNCKHIILATDNVTDDAQFHWMHLISKPGSTVPTGRLRRQLIGLRNHLMAIPVPDWLFIMFRMTITMLLTHTSM